LNNLITQDNNNLITDTVMIFVWNIMIIIS